MRIPRIFQEGNYNQGDIIEVSSDAYQHIIKVLRLKVNAKLILFNGQGTKFEGVISDIKKKSCLISLTTKLKTTPHTQQITLAQSIIKPDKMDLIFQKGVELGATRFLPLITDNCQIKQSKPLLDKRMEHWRKIIITACEQCGADYLPEVAYPMTISKLLEKYNQNSLIILDPYAKKTFNDIIEQDINNLTLVIGPEGGFTTSEIKILNENSAQAIKLGTQILRAETAAIAAIAISLFLANK